MASHFMLLSPSERMFARASLRQPFMLAIKCVFNNKLLLDLCHSRVTCNLACTSHLLRLLSCHLVLVAKCHSQAVCQALQLVVEVLSLVVFLLRELAVEVQLVLSKCLQVLSMECHQM